MSKEGAEPSTKEGQNLLEKVEDLEIEKDGDRKLS